MQKLIIANWKMHALSLTPWKKFHVPRNVRVVICPPFPYLKEVRQFVSKKVAVGAQDVFWENHEKGGAYTGEVSVAMIKNLGAEYVVIGHSERRKYLHETDEMIRKKIEAALSGGLKVILCVGEPSERGLTRTSRGITRNRKSAQKYVRNQLEKDLNGVDKLFHKSQRGSASSPQESAILIAYEPIWAIGTGIPDKPKDTLEMVKFIKTLCDKRFALRAVPVLYGGSVTGKNAKSFLHYNSIDGALVGGASLKIKEFEKIVAAAAT